MKGRRVFSFVLALFLIFSCAGCAETEPATTGEAAPDASLADVSEMNFTFSDRDQDSSYDSSKVKIAKVTDGVAAISAAGCYEFSDQTLRQIHVKAGDQDKIQIVLDGVTIENDAGPAIFIEKADKVFLTMKKGSENRVSDGSSYDLQVSGSTLDGAIFSKADLTLNGEGTLLIEGNYKHGIVSKDDLILVSLMLKVSAKKAAICGKDCVKFSGVTVEAEAGSDAIRSDNDENAARGFVYGEDATLMLTAGNDGIQAETVVKLQNVSAQVESGGGSSVKLSSSGESYKGIKAGSDILLSGGDYLLSTRDDGIHANHSIRIESGNFVISSGDDGIHADTDLSVEGGRITVKESYEAMEATRIFISGGTLRLTASDDGLNAAGGKDSSSFGGRPGMGHFSDSTGEIVISGGDILVRAQGDGIDSNGSIWIRGGLVLVDGPASGGDGSLDYDTTATVTGGILMALGSSGMAQGFSEAQNQGAILVGTSSQKAGTNLSLCAEDGTVLLSFTPKSQYQCAVISCPALQQGKSYTLVAGGEAVGLNEDGFVQNTTLSGGETVAAFTLTSLLYSEGGFGGPGGMGRPGGKGDFGDRGNFGDRGGLGPRL